jgi:hypothetical protein
MLLPTNHTTQTEERAAMPIPVLLLAFHHHISCAALRVLLFSFHAYGSGQFCARQEEEAATQN